jgi:hypothetical protein
MFGSLGKKKPIPAQSLQVEDEGSELRELSLDELGSVAGGGGTDVVRRDAQPLGGSDVVRRTPGGSDVVR